MKTHLKFLAVLSVLASLAGLSNVHGQIVVTFSSTDPGTLPGQNPIYTSGSDFDPPYAFVLNMHGDPRDITVTATFTAETTVNYLSGVGDADFEVAIQDVVLTIFGAGIAGGQQDISLKPDNAFTGPISPGGSGTANFLKSVTTTVTVTGGGEQEFTLAWGRYAAQVVPQDGKSTGDSTVYGIEGTVLVPEPSEYALLAGLGLVGFGLWRRFRR